MNKAVRIITLVLVCFFLIYNYYSRLVKRKDSFVLHSNDNAEDIKTELVRPSISLIFDGLGNSVNDLREIYSLGIPASVAVVPGLKFSKNIAYIAKRCGFSVLINLPVGDSDFKGASRGKYRLITPSLNHYQINRLLRYYLNSVRIANGVVPCGELKVKDVSFMKFILEEIKERNLLFIDNTTSSDSLFLKIAQELGIKTGYIDGYIDFSSDRHEAKQRLHQIIDIAKNKGKIIVAVFLQEVILEVLREELSQLKKEVSFITIEEYFEGQK